METYQNGETEAVRFGADGTLPVEFPRVVLRQILTFADAGVRKLSRGGMEAGGILFGRRVGAEVHVFAWRSIACEHTRGPAFLLSNDDRQALANQLGAAESDPALQVLEPVGFFVSHTRKGLVLTDEDRDLFDQFFPGPNRVCMVLHTRKGFATEAAVFLRGADGQLLPEPARRTLTGTEFPPIEMPMVEGPEAAAAGSGVPPRPQVAALRPAVWRRIPGWGYACLGVLLCGALVLAIPMRRAAGRDAAETLQLRLEDAKGQLRIEWDRESSTIRKAQNATLYITDGRPLAPVSLDRDTARKGFINYGRLSEDITVKLVVNRDDDTPIQELARFVGAPVPKEASKELLETRARREELLAEIRKLRAQIEMEVQRSQNLESSVARIERQIERGAR